MIAINSSIRKLLPRVLKQSLRRVYERATGHARLKRRHPTLILDRTARVLGMTPGRFVLLDRETSVWESQLGDHTYLAEGAMVLRSQIGKFCSIGPHSQIGLAGHPSRNFVSSHPVFYYALPHRNLVFADRDYFEGFLPTILGNDVWVGASALVKGGVRIGDGAIIGAGAVVTHDVPAYAIYGGVPAKLIRFRFDNRTIDFLCSFRWWDKDEAWLRSHFLKFHDVNEFERAFGDPPRLPSAAAPDARGSAEAMGMATNPD